jgi:glycosyltransferase involved in cell wall biosynthesis
VPAPTLHVIPFLWSGAGGVVSRLCEAQAGKGPVAIVTTAASGEMHDWPAYRRRLRRAGVTHHTIDFFHRDGAAFWSGVQALATLLRRLRPAVVHAHAGVPAAAAVIARDLSGHRTRIIGQMYSWGPDRPAWMNVQDMWGFARTDRVVCSARAYWNLLIDYGVPRRKLLYLPWGLPLDELPFRGAGAQRRTGAGRGANARQGSSAGETAGPALGFVGRIEPRKAQVTLVEMLALVRRRFPAATLDLVGPVADEAYAETLRASIVSAGLTDAVRLHDRVPSIAPFLRRWDLFVSMSSDEGQGLAVLEAMATGVPVVARRVAGIEDFLDDGRTGLAVASSAAAPAARAAIRLIDDPALVRRLATRARALVDRRYDWTRMLGAFDRVYGVRRRR